MDDITRRYMHDVRIMPSMGKAEIVANGWISNRPSVVQRFYRVWSTFDILLDKIDQPSASPETICFYSQALVLQAVLVWKTMIQSWPNIMSWSEDHMVLRLTYPTCRIGYEWNIRWWTS